MLPPNLKSPKPKSLNKTKGKFGEALASSYLSQKNYKIIDKNVSTRYGEIDIVARRPDNVTVFVEVKCRIGDKYGMPYESVTYGKLKRLSKVIQFYLLKNRLLDSKLAIEVVSIVLNEDKVVTKIHHFENIAIV